jgi:type IV pilus assembly protein PilB
MAQLIGQILIDMGVLDEEQVEKIVEHQHLSCQRFGQIAVAWHWVSPQDIWFAWARQLTQDKEVIDLEELGVDTAATEKVSVAIAQHYQVVAVRTWGDNLVLAVPEHMAELARTDLPVRLGGALFFCIARPEQVRAALKRLYATPVSCGKP